MSACQIIERNIFIFFVSSCLKSEELDDFQNVYWSQRSRRCLLLLFSQQIDVEAEYKKREQTNKAQINLVVIGKIRLLELLYLISLCVDSPWL